MSSAGFVHLHVHSAYSLLKGSIKIQKLADAMYLVVPPGTQVNSDGIREAFAADPSFDFMMNRG